MTQQKPSLPPVTKVDTLALSKALVGGCGTFSVQLMATHQACGQETLQTRVAYSENCKTDEQAYVRHLTIDKPTLVAAGCWVTDPGMLIVENRAGKGRSLNPTKKELAATEKQVLTLTREGETGYQIRPGRCFIGEPWDLGSLLLIPANGGKPCPVSITIIPR